MIFDWKLAIFALQFITSIVTIGIFCILKFNDLKHLTMNVSEISKNMDKVFRRLGKIEKDIVKREAVCSERHPKK